MKAKQEKLLCPTCRRSYTLAAFGELLVACFHAKIVGIKTIFNNVHCSESIESI